jgi:hypothetical protein
MSLEEIIESTKQQELTHQGNPEALKALAAMIRAAQHLLSLKRPN